MATAFPVLLSIPARTGIPKPRHLSLHTNRTSGSPMQRFRTNCAVLSALPSPTTKISQGIVCWRSAQITLSTVSTIQPASSFAGITTDSFAFQSCSASPHFAAITANHRSSRLASSAVAR